MQYGVLIRSPISKGTIRSISHPKLPENYTIISAKNIVGKNTIETNNIQYQNELDNLIIEREKIYNGDIMIINAYIISCVRMPIICRFF